MTDAIVPTNKFTTIRPSDYDRRSPNSDSRNSLQVAPAAMTGDRTPASRELRSRC